MLSFVCGFETEAQTEKLWIKNLHHAKLPKWPLVSHWCILRLLRIQASWAWRSSWH